VQCGPHWNDEFFSLLDMEVCKLVSETDLHGRVLDEVVVQGKTVARVGTVK
jgi:hypothetical protein